MPLTRVGLLFTRKDVTIPMRGWKANQTINTRIGQLGKISPVATTKEVKGNASTHPDRPRVNSFINDNQCITLL